ncbi:MAG: ArsR family metal-binding transcriptional regulator [Desulforhopalus sp.]|jgi:ArsR family metal-binding transcriptional regulator
MLLKEFSLEIFKSKCHSDAKGVHCFAHLDSDVRNVLPYLNTVLGGFVYTVEPPTLTLKASGKLITIHPQKIAVNALRDREEAEKIIGWLQREINETWERRAEIEPCTESLRQPVLIEVLKLLPKTNCRDCNEPTCMVFATRVIEGSKDQNDCPPIDQEKKVALQEYLSQFRFD